MQSHGQSTAVGRPGPAGVARNLASGPPQGQTASMPDHARPDAADPEASRPIDRVLEVLATARETPDAAVRECAARIDEAAPLLLGLLHRAALHGLSRERDRLLMFRAFPVLAATRTRAACLPLLRLLRRPVNQVEDILADALTETLPSIVVGVFDGDAPALFAALADRRIDEAARWSLFAAAAFLTAQGRIDAPAMHAFMRRFHAEALAPELDAAWLGWGEAVAMLGLRDLAEVVEGVWDRFPPEVKDVGRFREMLADALAAPHDPGRFDQANVGDPTDPLALLEWLRPSPGSAVFHTEPRPPAVNPLRQVGRNDPCPCGSGRKYKKCCMPGAAAPPPA